MADNILSLIDQLQEKLKVLAGYYPEAASLFDTAIAAIKTSTPRAIMGEKRTSAAARMTIISNLSAVFFVVTHNDDAGRHIARLCHSILTLSKEIIKDSPMENDPSGEVIAPEGWDANEEGILSRTLTTGDVLTITTRPHLPGGDWCLHFFNVPVSFGIDLDTTVKRAGNLERLILDAIAPVRALPVAARSLRSRVSDTVEADLSRPSML